MRRSSAASFHPRFSLPHVAWAAGERAPLRRGSQPGLKSGMPSWCGHEPQRLAWACAACRGPLSACPARLVLAARLGRIRPIALATEHSTGTIGNTAMSAARLTGARCQCCACGAYFNCVSMFDRHRVGSFADYGAHRRCLTAAQMESRRWVQNSKGFWIERRRLDAPPGSGVRQLPAMDVRGSHATWR